MPCLVSIIWFTILLDCVWSFTSGNSGNPGTQTYTGYNWRMAIIIIITAIFSRYSKQEHTLGWMGSNWNKSLNEVRNVAFEYISSNLTICACTKVVENITLMPPRLESEAYFQELSNHLSCPIKSTCHWENKVWTNFLQFKRQQKCPNQGYDFKLWLPVLYGRRWNFQVFPFSTPMFNNPSSWYTPNADTDVMPIPMQGE